MSPEAEAHKIIAISFGKIANSRVQRGGPKLCKNLLVANLIHKARTLYDEQVHCFQPKYVQSVEAASFENSESARSPDEEKAERTEVLCEDDDMLPSAQKDYPCDDLKRSIQTVNECDDKENDSPDVSSDVGEISRVQTGSRTRPDLSTMLKSRAIPSRCLKRRNCSEGKADYENHRSPTKRFCERRSRRRSSSTDTLDLPPLVQQECYDSDSPLSTEVMDVEQISSLVTAFSNSLKDFSYASCVSKDSESVSLPDKTVQSTLWRSNSVPDMVLCAQQVTSVLKMRQGFETSTPVVA